MRGAQDVLASYSHSSHETTCCTGNLCKPSIALIHSSRVDCLSHMSASNTVLCATMLCCALLYRQCCFAVFSARVEAFSAPQRDWRAGGAVSAFQRSAHIRDFRGASDNVTVLCELAILDVPSHHMHVYIRTPARDLYPQRRHQHQHQLKLGRRLELNTRQLRTGVVIFAHYKQCADFASCSVHVAC